MNKPIFSFKNLKFKKNNNLLLDIRKFDIHRGSCYMFYGDMGSGKSLILDIMTKRVSGYKGQVLYDNDDLKKMVKNQHDFEVSDVEITLIGKCNKHD